MATALLTTAAERAQALAQLQQAFGQVNGGMEFTYQGVIYQSLGLNVDGTLRVLSLATGQITAIDPVSVYEAALAAQGDLPSDADQANNYTKVGAPPVPILQQIMAQAGTVASLVNGIEQAIGNAVAGAAAAVANPTAAFNAAFKAATLAGKSYEDAEIIARSASDPSGLKVFLDNVLNNAAFKEGLGILGAVLSTYSVFTGIQTMFDKGPTAGSAAGVLGGAVGIATSVNTLLAPLSGSLVGAYGGSLLNPLGWGVAGAVVSASIIFNGIQSMLKNGATAGQAGAVAGGVVGMAVSVNLIAAFVTHVAVVAANFAAISAGTALSAVPGISAGAFTNPVGWFAAGAVISATFLWSSINSMVSNGISAAGMAEAIGTFVALAVLANMAIAATLATIAILTGAAAAGTSVMSAAVAAMFTGPWGWVIAGAIVLFAVLWAVFHQPPAETQAAMSLNKALTPIIYSAGPLVMVAIGTTAALMGMPKTGSRSVMSSITIPSYYATNTLSKAAGISKLALTANQTPTVLIEPGTANSPETVDIVTPTGGNDPSGNALVNIESYVLSGNLKFVSGSSIPQDAYIPLFTYDSNDKPHFSPAYLNAMENQQELLRSVLSGGLTMQGSISAVQLASAVSHPNINPNN